VSDDPHLTFHTIELHGNGIVHNETSCNATVHGKMTAEIQHHETFLPGPFQPLSTSETEKLKFVTTNDITQLDLSSTKAKAYVNRDVHTVFVRIP
jgi:hypothetical protein